MDFFSSNSKEIDEIERLLAMPAFDCGKRITKMNSPYSYSIGCPHWDVGGRTFSATHNGALSCQTITMWSKSTLLHAGKSQALVPLLLVISETKDLSNT